MKAITLFNGEGLFSFDSLVKLCTPMIQLAKEDKTYLHRMTSRKWFLAEIYCHLKKAGDLPELPIERKREIWAEAKGDKLLAYSLYLIEIL